MSDSAVHIALNTDRSRAALRLFHPKGNIVTAEMIAALLQALDPLANDPHLKLLTIEGTGADFSFGASIAEHAPGEIDRVLPEAHALIYALLDFPAPTAAIVRGRCLGGGFEIALGVFPPAAAALLPPRIGVARATRAILTGAAHSADAMATAGLIEEVCGDGTVAARVDRWFDIHLRGRSAAALRYAATAARLSLVQHARTLLPELERLYLSDLMGTADAAEGVAAFLETRAPRWTDR